VRLLCPRHLAESTGNPTDGFNSIRDIGILTCNGQVISVPYHHGTGLPIITTVAGIENFTKYCARLSISPPDKVSQTVSHSTPPVLIKQNLSPQQRLKLLLHERCNHKNMKTLNHWIRQGHFNVNPSIASVPDPICVACQYGKAHKKAHKTDNASITERHRYPGAGVSADQLEAGYPGKLPTTKGLPTTKRYKYCNLWVDHYSKYIYPTFHETKEVSEMVKSKQDFQAFAARFNVKIRSIRADNGAYASALFKTACDLDQQDLTFCAVGGHWQNGVAERYIGIVTQTARTLLLHAMANWPGIVNEEFWPFAIRHACTFHNASIRTDLGKSPHHLFTGNKAPWSMDDFRVFGSPVFVLDKKLQDGDSLAKWKARSWLGVYVGHSLVHSGNAPVIYNPRTTHISPQFHVVIDDNFSTVTSKPSELSADFITRLYNNSTWFHDDLYTNTSDLHTFDTYWTAPPYSKQALRKPKKTKLTGITQQTNQVSPHSDRDVSSDVQNKTTTSQVSIHTPTNKDNNNNSDLAVNSTLALSSEQATSSKPAIPSEHADPGELAIYTTTSTTEPLSSLKDESTTRINLVQKPCSAPFQALKATLGIQAEVYTALKAETSSSISPLTESDTPINDGFTSLLTYQTESFVPKEPTYVAFNACNNKEDILTQSQMFKADDNTDFIACQRDEIEGLKKFVVMNVEHISQLPPRAKLISSIWSYQRKRLPNGVLLKHKARICVNGKEQAFGRYYWETYAPVASWSTIRLLLLLSTLMNLKTRQVDYTQAFPQAKLEDPVYMKVPQGWYVDSTGELAQHNDPTYNDTSHYLKLKRNLYGCKQAARNWFKHLTDGLINQGFTQSKTDSCLFL
jgi:hypothetical protein